MREGRRERERESEYGAVEMQAIGGGVEKERGGECYCVCGWMDSLPPGHC